MSRISSILLLLTLMCVSVVLMSAGLSLRLSLLILLGGSLSIVTMLGLAVLYTVDLYETNKQRELYAACRREFSELNEWLVGFVKENANATAYEEAETMLSFVANYVHTHMAVPNYHVLLLDESEWLTFLRKWLSPHTSPHDRVELDSGARVPVERLVSGSFFGMCLQTALYRAFDFPFDFVILLNIDRIRKRAHAMATGNRFGTEVVYSTVLNQVLMHEVVHMCERILNQRLMFRYMPGDLEDPFVLEVYNAFRENSAW